MEWGYDCRIPIDTGVFLNVEVVKAIVDLKFNPGEGVAHLSLAAKGLSILSCQGRTTGEIERLKEREEALMATKKTRQLDKLIRLQKDQRRTPADNFLELKNNIATFMGLVWILFGSNCDYYKGLRNVYATMDLRDFMAIKLHFTAKHCRRITWAIIDETDRILTMSRRHSTSAPARASLSPSLSSWTLSGTCNTGSLWNERISLRSG